MQAQPEVFATQDFAEEGGERARFLLSLLSPLGPASFLLPRCGRGEGGVIASVISVIIILIA